MNHKKIAVIFVVLLLLAMIPFPFTKGPQMYLFGWLPLTLVYWWTLMVTNLVFVLWVSHVFVKNSKKESGHWKNGFVFWIVLFRIWQRRIN